MRKILLMVMVAVAVAGCGSNQERAAEVETPKPKMARLEAGAPVNLVLLEPLESGKSAEGTKFKMALSADVKGSDGSIVIPAGSIAEGEVVWSRRGRVEAAIVNQPARLAIKVTKALAQSGVEVDLKTAERQYEFKSENTHVAPLSLQLSAPLSEEQRSALQNLSDNGLAALDDPKVRQALGTLPIQGKAQNKGKDPITSLGEKVASGRFDRIGSQELMSLTTVSNVADSVLDKLGRMLTAHQVYAPVGTPIPAFVAHETTITIPSAPIAD